MAAAASGGNAVNSDVLEVMRERLPSLSTAEQRVATAILQSPSLVLDNTITELAEVCETSPATVARLCQRLGFSGYRELRVKVAAATSREQAELDRFQLSDSEIDPAESLSEVAAKIAYQETRAINDTTQSLDFDTLEKVVAVMTQAPLIDIYGFSTSGLTGLDLQQKLRRIGLSVNCWTDVHLALPSAAVLHPGSVAIAISHSGVTLEAIQAIETAHAAGATTVVITNYPNSPLADRADFVLATRARENRFRSGAMSSRIAQLALVDVLFVRIAQDRYEQTAQSLRLTYESIQSHRVPYERKNY